ncbi:type II toxin-antitoxin system Phd/YefM family antitoxin, partial [Klebsiella pneumoniae]
MATASAGGGYPVAIIDRNRPVFYCVPAALYEQMRAALDEKDLVPLLTSSPPRRARSP